MGVQSIQSLLTSSITQSSRTLTTLLAKLATQDRLAPSPATQASVFSLSELLNSQLASLEATSSTVNLGGALASIADAQLASASEQLSQVRALEIQANSGFADDATRASIQSAIDTQVQSISTTLSALSGAGRGTLSNAAFTTSNDTAGILNNVAFTQTPAPVGNGIDVDVTVNAQATQATTTLTGVSGATSFTLIGNEGSVEVAFTGTTSAELTTEINQFTSQTGITATDLGGGQVQLESASGGSAQFVSVQDVTGTGFTAGAGLTSGTDADIEVNGVAVVATGDLASFNVGGLAGTFTVTGVGQTTVAITGGGITVPTDASGGTLTFGVPTLNPENLGTSSGLGSIAQLSGGSAPFSDRLAIIDAAQSELLASRVQLGGVSQALGSAGASIESQLASASSTVADLRGADVAEIFSQLENVSAQRQLQLALVRRSSLNQGGVLRLLGGVA